MINKKYGIYIFIPDVVDTDVVDTDVVDTDVVDTDVVDTDVVDTDVVDTDVVDRTILYIYIYASQERLETALPLSYSPDKGDYIGAYFKNGSDYIGQSTYSQVVEWINDKNMIDIENNTWDYIKKELPGLKYEVYDQYLKFGKTQIEQSIHDTVDNRFTMFSFIVISIFVAAFFAH
jgi:hypothetical protein